MDKDLSDIDKRLINATPGPWEYFLRREGCWVIHNNNSEADNIIAYNEADAAFIAHARQDIDILLEEVRVLRALLNQGASGNSPAFTAS